MFLKPTRYFKILIFFIQVASWLLGFLGNKLFKVNAFKPRFIALYSCLKWYQFCKLHVYDFYFWQKHKSLCILHTQLRLRRFLSQPCGYLSYHNFIDTLLYTMRCRLHSIWPVLALRPFLAVRRTAGELLSYRGAVYRAQVVLHAYKRRGFSMLHTHASGLRFVKIWHRVVKVYVRSSWKFFFSAWFLIRRKQRTRKPRRTPRKKQIRLFRRLWRIRAMSRMIARRFRQRLFRRISRGYTPRSVKRLKWIISKQRGPKKKRGWLGREEAVPIFGKYLKRRITRGSWSRSRYVFYKTKDMRHAEKNDHLSALMRIILPSVAKTRRVRAVNYTLTVPAASNISNWTNPLRVGRLLRWLSARFQLSKSSWASACRSVLRKVYRFRPLGFLLAVDRRRRVRRRPGRFSIKNRKLPDSRFGHKYSFKTYITKPEVPQNTTYRRFWAVQQALDKKGVLLREIEQHSSFHSFRSHHFLNYYRKWAHRRFRRRFNRRATSTSKGYANAAYAVDWYFSVFYMLNFHPIFAFIPSVWDSVYSRAVPDARVFAPERKAEYPILRRRQKVNDYSFGRFGPDFEHLVLRDRKPENISIQEVCAWGAESEFTETFDHAFNPEGVFANRRLANFKSCYSMRPVDDGDPYSSRHRYRAPRHKHPSWYFPYGQDIKKHFPLARTTAYTTLHPEFTDYVPPVAYVKQAWDDGEGLGAHDTVSDVSKYHPADGLGELLYWRTRYEYDTDAVSHTEKYGIPNGLTLWDNATEYPPSNLSKPLGLFTALNPIAVAASLSTLVRSGVSWRTNNPKLEGLTLLAGERSVSYSLFLSVWGVVSWLRRIRYRFFALDIGLQNEVQHLGMDEFLQQSLTRVANLRRGMGSGAGLETPVVGMYWTKRTRRRPAKCLVFVRRAPRKSRGLRALMRCIPYLSVFELSNHFAFTNLAYAVILRYMRLRGALHLGAQQLYNARLLGNLEGRPKRRTYTQLRPYKVYHAQGNTGEGERGRVSWFCRAPLKTGHIPRLQYPLKFQYTKYLRHNYRHNKRAVFRIAQKYFYRTRSFIKQTNPVKWRKGAPSFLSARPIHGVRTRPLAVTLRPHTALCQQNLEISRWGLKTPTGLRLPLFKTYTSKRGLYSRTPSLRSATNILGVDFTPLQSYFSLNLSSGVNRWHLWQGLEPDPVCSVSNRSRFHVKWQHLYAPDPQATHQLPFPSAFPLTTFGPRAGAAAGWPYAHSSYYTQVYGYQHTPYPCSSNVFNHWGFVGCKQGVSKLCDFQNTSWGSDITPGSTYGDFIKNSETE